MGKILDNKKVLYILDGYDEVAELNHKSTTRLWSIVENLLRQNNVILTSRPDRKLDLDGSWQKLEISEFSENNVHEYINNYFRENRALAKLLKKLVKENLHLLSFAKLPVYLDDICEIREISSRKD